MAGLLTGIPRQVINSSGGVKNFFICAFSEVSATNEGTTGVAITLADGTVIDETNNPFAKYTTTKLSSGIVATSTRDPATGQQGTEQVATMIFHKIDTAKDTEISLLKKNELVVISQDFNGAFVAMGTVNGADLITNAQTTGNTHADLNGYTLTIRALEPTDLLTIDSTLISVLKAM